MTSDAAEHEGLRRAVAWLLEHPRRDALALEEASREFDLSPLDEEFLLRHFGTARPSGRALHGSEAADVMPDAEDASTAGMTAPPLCR